MIKVYKKDGCNYFYCEVGKVSCALEYKGRLWKKTGKKIEVEWCEWSKSI